MKKAKKTSKRPRTNYLDGSKLTFEEIMTSKNLLTFGGKPVILESMQDLSNDPSSPTPRQDAPPSPTPHGGVGCSAWLGSWSTDSIDKLLHEPNQNLGHELEYGSLQPIAGWEPGQEIQHDGHSRYVVVTPHKKERISEQTHPESEIQQSRHNNALSPSYRDDASKSRCGNNLQNVTKNQGQQVSCDGGVNEPNDPSSPTPREGGSR